MGIGLTFDEYMDVKLEPPAGADRPIQRGHEAHVAEMFPMSTASGQQADSRTVMDQPL